MFCKSSVVKLGGSLITIKDRICTVNWDLLTSAVEQLVEYLRQGGRLVVVHGGGSFGHPAVKEVIEEYGKKDVRGASYVQEVMLSLAMKVLKVFRSYEAQVTLHTTHTLCSCSRCSYESVIRDYNVGLVPIVYGDAVPCNDEFTVISGDRLASEIASTLKTDCLVYAVDVPGVLANGEVIRKGRVDEIISLLGESTDVTGGMKGKVLEAVRALEDVRRVIIVGGQNNGIIRALRGEEVGTEIVK